MKEKRSGFTFALVVAVLLLITAGVYFFNYRGTNYLSMQAVYALLGGAVISFLMLLVKLDRFAPALQFGAITVALCFYIYYIYFFISSAIYGIQYSGLPLDFYVVAACYVVTFLFAIINCFIPHKAKEQ